MPRNNSGAYCCKKIYVEQACLVQSLLKPDHKFINRPIQSGKKKAMGFNHRIHTIYFQKFLLYIYQVNLKIQHRIGWYGTCSITTISH